MHSSLTLRFLFTSAAAAAFAAAAAPRRLLSFTAALSLSRSSFFVADAEHRPFFSFRSQRSSASLFKSHQEPTSHAVFPPSLTRAPRKRQRLFIAPAALAIVDAATAGFGHSAPEAAGFC